MGEHVIINWRTSSFSGGNGCVDVGWTRSSFCASGTCVEVASGRCSSGSCVEVSHQDGVILVRDSKTPDAKPIEWSPDMWESSVWQRIVDGYLPAYAREVGQPVPALLQLPKWQGGDVRWADLEFTSEEWKAFVDGVMAGEFAVEVLTR